MGIKEINRKEILNTKTFGEFCRACRKANKVSQTEVGELLGYSGNHISDFERGQVDSLTIYYFYAIYFGASINNYMHWCIKNKVEIFNTDLLSCFIHNREFRSEIHGKPEDNDTERLLHITCHNEMSTYYDIKGYDFNSEYPRKIIEDEILKFTEDKQTLNSLYGMQIGDNNGLSTTDKKTE